MSLALDRISKAASAATHFRGAGGLLMRCVSFLLVICAVAGTSSVRGEQPADREGRQERRDDRQEGRQERRDDRQEARGDRGDDHELLRLAVLAALRNGDFGDRQSVREERREGREERRDERRDSIREARIPDGDRE